MSPGIRGDPREGVCLRREAGAYKDGRRRVLSSQRGLEEKPALPPEAEERRKPACVRLFIAL